ncbi:MAG: hypothetical protein ACETWG_05395 [Candidatus Neomarinimicrobiota bacterium]
MFDINLLLKPGLQEAIVWPEEEVLEDREAAIISRLQGRLPAEALAVVTPKPRAKSRFLPWIVVLLVILVVAVYWWYQGWSWRQWRELFPFREPAPAVGVPEGVGLRPGTCVTAVAQVLEELPVQASLDFIDAGVGVLIYWVSGEDLAKSLLQLNTRIEGRQYSDLITPSAPAPPDYWLGTIAFDARDQVGALRPSRSDYDRFFRRLQKKVSNTGGVVLEMVPGIMTAGEYVIQGTLDEIRAHLTTALIDSSGVHYHRLSVLKPEQLAGDSYLLRVIFNLIEEPILLQRSSSPADTGA